MPDWDRRDWWLAALAAVLAGAVYVLTLAPTVTAEDSGELITAACTLGVAHPPGYPLWCLLGKAFSLLPLRNPAWRLNLMSAVFAALTVSLAYATCRLLSLGRAPSFGGALCLAFSLQFWSQSVIAEVYTLNTFLLGAVVVLLLIWGRTRRRVWLMAAAGAFGLGLANHYMLMLLVSPALAAYVLLTEPRILRDARTLGLCAVLAAAPLMIYVYLPLSAASGGPLHWGEMDSLRGFWAHVSRASYRRIDYRGGFSLLTKARFLGHFLGLLWRQFTPWVLVPLGLLGLWQLRYRPRGLALLGGVFLFNTVVLLLLMQLPYTSADRSRVEAYYLPAYFAAAVVIGAGLSRAAKPLADMRGPLGAACALLFCLGAPAVLLLNNWAANDMSRNYLAYDYGMAALNGLEKDAVYFAAPDFSAFPAVYLQAVEGVRPDVILADVTGLPSPRARSYVAEIAPQATPGDMDAAQEAMLTKGSRPVYFCPLARPIDLRRFRLDPWGLAFRAQPWQQPNPEGAPDPFAGGAVRNIPLDVPAGDIERALAACYYLMWAEQSMSRGDFAEAVPRYARAADLLAGYRSYLTAVGAFCARRDLRVLEEACYRMALDVDTDYPLALANLGVLTERQGRFGEAQEMYRHLLALDPANRWATVRAAAVSAVLAHGAPATVQERIPEVRAELGTRREDARLLTQLGDLYLLAGDPAEARAAYEEARTAHPDYGPVYGRLARFYEQVVQDRRTAEGYVRKARELAPAAEAPPAPPAADAAGSPPGG
jgi:Flp pilus assembly protein TadD